MTRDKLASYVAMLAGEFDLKTFNRATLDRVAGSNEFFPAYAKLREMLGEWEREQSARRMISGRGRMPDWLRERILAEGQIGPMMQKYLDEH